MTRAGRHHGSPSALQTSVVSHALTSPALDAICHSCQIDNAIGRHQTVRGANTVDAAIARRNAHRAAAVGAEREIDEAAGDRSG